MIVIMFLLFIVAIAAMIAVVVAKKKPPSSAPAVAEYPLVEYPRRRKGAVRGYLLGHDRSGRARIRLAHKPHVIVRRGYYRLVAEGTE